ncbi:MAG: hypothetical protein MJZ32_12775 [Bacteroidaceae bacterium]|nr:hypothetical protein [Bacteroidaceae bacterium]
MNLRTGQKGAYPNFCRIVRRVGETSFKKAEEKLIYEGECVLFGSGQMRKFTLGNIVKADFCVEIPHALVDKACPKGNVMPCCFVKPGDRISVEGRFSDCEVVLGTPDEVFEMGTTVYFNATMN